MLLPLYNRTVRMKSAAYTEFINACRKSGLIADNMEAASSSLVGHVLLSRPQLIMTFNEKSGFHEFSPFTADMDDHEDDDILHSPMLYVADERIINGRPSYIMIMLNAPECEYRKLGQYYPFIRKAFQKMPVFNGGLTPRNVCDGSGKDRISLLIPNKQANKDQTGLKASKAQKDAPFLIIDDPDSVALTLSYLENNNMLAFRGQCIIPKDNIAQHMALSDLFAAENMCPDIMLSPYAESKYFRAFQHAGFCLEDISRIPQWSAQTAKAASLRH